MITIEKKPKLPAAGTPAAKARSGIPHGGFSCEKSKNISSDFSGGHGNLIDHLFDLPQ